MPEVLKEKFKPLFNFWNLPFGNVATASFIIAVLSGVFLALPFDVKNPYESISLFLLTNPPAVFFRNVHYWSAQLFLIFTVLHIIDHLRRKTEYKLKDGVWFRLTLLLFFSFYVMISGFILKADADSQQALRIFESLLNEIPFIGKSISLTLLGSEGDFQIIYVNHIATATIILSIIIIEHSKIIWPKLSVFIYSLLSSVLLGYIFSPILHDGLHPVVKGPWYFVGIQEILHWISYTQLVIILTFILFLLFYLLKKFPERISSLIKKVFVSFGLIYLILTIIGYYFRGENWEFVLPWNNTYNFVSDFQPLSGFADIEVENISYDKFKTILGRKEGCIVCHQMSGFEDSHNPNAIGCYSCHRGNAFSLNKNAAHSGMILIPGNLNYAQLTCGTSQCHPDIFPRVNNSIMSTLSGIVSVNRFVFDESNSPTMLNHIKDIKHSDADSHLRNLCASCHLGNEKTEYGPVNELSRGGGCNACHLNYSNEAFEQLNNFKKSKVKGQKSNDKKIEFPKIHPQLSLKISNDHCFGCHSRSGRISTNYEGWFETLLNDNEIIGFSHSVPILSGSESIGQKLNQVQLDEKEYRLLMDGRVFQKAEEDVHHKAGMECIDCHIAQEIMGDGNLYKHKEEQVKIQCTDCHSNQIKSVSYNELDYESRKIIDIRKSFKSDAKFISTQNGNLALTNSYITKNGIRYLITKDKKDSLTIKPPAFICTEGKSHQRLSCNSCHTQWVSYCVGCHTTYNQNEEGFDLLDNKDIIGSWMETPSDFYVDYPVLGIKKDKSGKEIIDTFIPGMIIKLENLKTDKNKKIFKRLFAPTFSHTINKSGRSCKSCHNNPLALGYGKGKLSYIIVDRETNSQAELVSASSNSKNRTVIPKQVRNDKSIYLGKWIFEPQFSNNKEDNLPKDAWIGFMQTRDKSSTTRANARPFTVEEQQRILLVGACLNCHEENSSIIKESLIDFDKVLNRVSDKCVVTF
uniref:Cytochrome b/b6 N-terminal region profile domain-containing protein n=1 Tax=Ignavibacterium album TaxID=591197 RepID=A0A832DF05_9BACT